MKIIIITLCALTFSWSILIAQPGKTDLTHTILSKDSLFWKAYNTCDLNGMKQYLTNDIEFYHDKGGATIGLENLLADIQKNLCGNMNLKLRREILDSSVKVFPLQKENELYGAVISGEHVFYVLENGKEERLDGQAKFTHIWLLKDNLWKMSRIISYDHGPARYINRRKAIVLKREILDQYLGQYIAPHAGTFRVEKENESLQLLLGNQKLRLYPQSENSFFVNERDLTFEFTKDEKGKISKMIIREKGKVVDEAVLKI